ncbi:MAG: ATP-grasp domain-containing protein [Rhodovulum sp.]|jgi:biotin carboxylase|nr:ATP-grasp domain-containing protein [Rhodovulum sp.]
MGAVLFGVQGNILMSVAKCLRAADVPYSIVSTPQTLNRMDADLCPPHARALPRNVFAQSEYDAMNAVQEHAASLGGAVLVPTDMRATRMLANAGGALHPMCAGFATATPGLIDTLDNKWSFHRLLGDLDLPSPGGMLIQSLDDPALNAVPFPAVMKPLAIGGGIGIHCVSNREEMAAALAQWPAVQVPFLIQEYLPGKDIDISILADRGRIIAHAVQAWDGQHRLRFFDDPDAYDMARQLVAQTGFSGVAHFDMRRDARDGVLRFIECNPRFWATVDAAVHTGVNFAALGVQMAMGHDVGTVTPRATTLTHARDTAPDQGFSPRGRIIATPA